MKNIIIQLLILLLFVPAMNAQIPIGTISKGENINVKQEINITNGGNKAILKQAEIKTEKKITFTESEVLMDNMIFVCDQLVFAQTVTKLQIRGNVKFECKQILFDGPGPKPEINIENSGKAELSFRYSGSLNNKRKIVECIEDGENFSIKFEKK